MPEKIQEPQPVGARLKQVIQSKKLETLSYREWRERLQKHGQAPSEATISRDLRWDTAMIPIQRLEIWAKAIGVPLKQLVSREELERQMLQPKMPSQEIVQSAKNWAFCPYKHCTTASWAIWKQTGEAAKFRDYGWFNAEEEGRYCRRCGTELVKECRTPSCKKKKIENRGDLYCGTCGKRFAETAVIAPYELWNRALDEDWKHYTREQQSSLLHYALARFTNFGGDAIPLDLTESLANSLEYCVLGTSKRFLQPDGSAKKMLSHNIESLRILEGVVQRLNDTVPPLLSAVKANNQRYFDDLENGQAEARYEAWKKKLEQSEQEKTAQGLVEPSEMGDVAVQVPPPEEPDIPF